jgi:tRNA dimethylallyltransferase
MKSVSRKRTKPIVIMGPTSSGKTDLALELSRLLGGEIISADSRQIYKHLIYGTAKPQGTWESSSYKVEGIPYHMVDFLDLNETFDVQTFVNLSKKLERQIVKRGHVSVFAGGTGMYIQSYFLGLDSLPTANEEIRDELTSLAKKHGKKHLHDTLEKIDPVAAEKIPYQNIQRVIRAIEVYRLTDTPISKHWSKNFDGKLPANKALFVNLSWSREIVKKRIEQRLNSVFDDMISEAKQALDMGYKKTCPALKTIGYPQVMDYLGKKISKREALEKTILQTHAYAKRQTTWFKRYKNVLTFHFENETDWNLKDICKRIIESYEK